MAETPLERGPDASGHFGRFGGRFVPETLMSPLAELEAAYAAAQADPAFRADLERLRRTFCGRPTPLYRARRFEATTLMGDELGIDRHRRGLDGAR